MFRSSVTGLFSSPMAALAALSLLPLALSACSGGADDGTVAEGSGGVVNSTGGVGNAPATGGASVGVGGAGAAVGTGGGALGTGGSAIGAGGSAPAAGGAGPAAGGAGSGGITGAGGTPGAGGDGAGGSDPVGMACETEEEKKFSMFATSHLALIDLSGNPDGFGGDLRYPEGETDGLKGADAICQAIAEQSSACQSSKVWKAFLSTSTVDAIDNIPEGPYYDRNGRFVAEDKAELISEDRPPNADSAIQNDFPNEDGVPNHKPNGDGMEVDNHQFITGTGVDGRLYAVDDGATGTGCGPEKQETWSIEGATCNDWTNNGPSGCPRVGHSWGSPFSGMNWMSVWNEGGCEPGGTLEQVGGLLPEVRWIGSAGGYGGFFCFSTGEE